MRRPIITLFLLTLMLTGLGACGQKGPLERPEETVVDSAASIWKRV